VEFAKRYRAELRRIEAAAAISEIIDLAKRSPVTSLTASRDLEHSEAAVLATRIRTLIARHAAVTERD
jgi:uncharacterized protein YeaO (DUF488 family)